MEITVMPKSTQALPPFVVDGEFEDTEWRDAAATIAPMRKKGERRVYDAGPRRHPYGASAYRDVKQDGTARWFESKQARDEYVNQNEPEEASRARGGDSPLQADAEERGRRESAQNPANPVGSKNRGKITG
jgi:hypothetical protein